MTKLWNHKDIMKKHIFIPVNVEKIFIKNKQTFNNMIVNKKKEQYKIIIKRQFHSFHNPPPLPPDIIFLALSVCSMYLINR